MSEAMVPLREVHAIATDLLSALCVLRANGADNAAQAGYVHALERITLAVPSALPALKQAAYRQRLDTGTLLNRLLAVKVLRSMDPGPALVQRPQAPGAAGAAPARARRLGAAQ